jgi:hypothetical protein
LCKIQIPQFSAQKNPKFPKFNRSACRRPEKNPSSHLGNRFGTEDWHKRCACPREDFFTHPEMYKKTYILS